MFNGYEDALACPACKGDVASSSYQKINYLECISCDKIYQIRNGIPVMLSIKANDAEKFRKGDTNGL